MSMSSASSSYSDDDYEEFDFDNDDGGNAGDGAPQQPLPAASTGRTMTSTDDDMPGFGDPSYASSTASTPRLVVHGPGGRPIYEPAAGESSRPVEGTGVRRDGIRSRQRQQPPVNLVLPLDDNGDDDRDPDRAAHHADSTVPPPSPPAPAAAPESKPDDGDDNDDDYSSDYSDDEYSDDNYDDDTEQNQQAMLGHSVSLPHIGSAGGPDGAGEPTPREESGRLPLHNSSSHPILTSPTAKRLEAKQYGEYVAKSRPWVQRRAMQVHRTGNSMFGSLSRPVLPMTIGSRADIDYLAALTVGTTMLPAQSGPQQRRTGRQRRPRGHTVKEADSVRSSSVDSLPSLLHTMSPNQRWGSPTQQYSRYGGGGEGGKTVAPTVDPSNTAELRVWLFDRLRAIMKVYRLRSKDIFASLDRDGDGWVSTKDMRFSLGVMGLQVRPRHAARLVESVVAMSRSRGLDFVSLEFALRRANYSREKRLALRMGRYANGQSAIADRIRDSQDSVNQLVASACTELDATRSIRDPLGKRFWNYYFSTRTPSVPLWRLLKELKKELWKRPPPGTDLGRDKATNDKWVFRRIGSLLNGGFKRKPVTASQFGELLDLFGPMQQLLERVLVGPLQSKEMQKRKRMRRRKQQQNKNAFVIRKGRTRKRVVPL